MVYRIKSAAAAPQRVEETQQVLFVQQPEFEMHEGLLELQLAQGEFGGIRVRALHADVVLDAEYPRLLVGDAQAVEPVDALLLADETGAGKLLIGPEKAADHFLLFPGVLYAEPRFAQLPLALLEKLVRPVVQTP